MKLKIYILAIGVVLISAFQTSLGLIEIPTYFPKPVYDFSKNPLSSQKIQLGRALFYDPILSRNQTISCASCHSQFNAFAHSDHALSHGIDDKVGTRNAPALMNLAWKNNFMWDGAIHHLDVQALAPISNPLEMDENINQVIFKLQTSKIYPALFYSAFGDTAITGERMLKAMSQFMLTLVSSQSKYDSVMRHEATFNAQELKGYTVFKNNCAVCHTEPLFTNETFKNNGLTVDTTLNDYGRVMVTHNPTDSFKFKVPTLRNIAFTYPYMHDGRYQSLSQVITHYTSLNTTQKNLAKELQKPLVLTSNQKVDLMAFLLTLTDKHFMFNQNYFYPKEIFSGTTKDK